MLCPSCGAQVSTQTRQCGYCGRDLRETAGPSAARPLAPRPTKYRIVDDGLNLEISWRWFTPAVFFMLFFAIAWNAFLVGWYAIASSMPAQMGAIRWIAMLFPIVHVAIGFGLAYGVLVTFVNSTTVRVDRGELTVRHGPVYFPGAITLDTSDIDQLFVAEQVKRTKSGVSITSTLRARTRDNRVFDLVKHVLDSSDAVFLEQTLEKYLKISDRPVAGEISHA